MGGNTSIHGNGTMGGRGGSKDSSFSFFILKNDAFVLPRERKSKDEESEGKKKKHSSEHLLKKARSLVRLSCVVKVCFIQLCGSVCSCLSGLFLVEARKDYSWHVQGHSVDTDALQEADL